MKPPYVYVVTSTYAAPLKCQTAINWQKAEQLREKLCAVKDENTSTLMILIPLYHWRHSSMDKWFFHHQIWLNRCGDCAYHTQTLWCVWCHSWSFPHSNFQLLSNGGSCHEGTKTATMNDFHLRLKKMSISVNFVYFLVKPNLKIHSHIILT